MLATGTTLPRLDRCVGAAKFDPLHTFQLPRGITHRSDLIVAVRVADRDTERVGVNRLIDRKYSLRGYGSGHQIPTSENSATFTISSKDRLIGTLSLTVDCPAGLAADKTFGDELDEFRKRSGARICELTKFAVEISRPSMSLLASLFHTILIYGTHKFDCTDLFIEVNSRHCRFYEMMLGFNQLGPSKTNRAVGVESHLMWLKVSKIRRQIDKYRTGLPATGRSLYPFFLSRREETEVRMRLFGEEGANSSSARRLPKTEMVANGLTISFPH